MGKYLEQDSFIDAYNTRKVPTYLTVLFVIYIALSFFEVYFVRFIGTNSRYLIFLIAIMFLYENQWKISKRYYIVFFILWFVFKVISISWSSWENTDITRLFVSQIGMIVFLSAVCSYRSDTRFLRTIILANYWSSFVFGLLTLRFHKSFQSEVFVARQVLTLFGSQNDPNNCAAFLAIGVSIAAYSLVAEKRNRWLNILVILVNVYGIMLTASRTGFLLLVAIVAVLALIPDTNERFVLRSFLKKLIIIAVIFVIGVIIINKYLPSASLNRMIAFDEYAGASGRDEKWDQAIELIKQRPLFGWGWGGYFVGAGIVHNTYLTMLCDIGLFGTLLFILPLIKLSVSLLKNKYQLAILLLVTGLFPALAIDSINKRYFWNAIIIPIMMLVSYQCGEGMVAVWPEKARRENVDE